MGVTTCHRSEQLDTPEEIDYSACTSLNLALVI